jgi:hypothetical protein
MKLSRLLTISTDMSLILSIEKNEIPAGHYTIGIQSMDSHRQINNKLQITMDEKKTRDFFEEIEKLKCGL